MLSAYFSTVYQFFIKKHPRKTGVGALVLFILYWNALPNPLFQDPTSFVLEDRNGELLGARIATDGQWRFPDIDTVPPKFEKAIIAFEDRRFYFHFGIDPLSIGRAIGQNLKKRSIVSGGSTLTMQVIRLSRKGKSRNLWQKIVEAVLATRLELGYKKSSILRLYASNAPFGGNVVGLEAAAWRYFGKSANLLSWGEAATLAVLPNAPALIHPGRNRQALLHKRNRLLDRLYSSGKMDAETCALAKAEPLPQKPLPLPMLAPHLLDRAFSQTKQQKNGQNRIETTLDKYLQQSVMQILEAHQRDLTNNGIHNIAALVLDVETGKTLAYVGNIENIESNEEHGQDVDIITASRSTGSLLKPWLYAMMLDEGQILPTALVPDIPTQMQNYRPQNYMETYDGAVPAKRAIARSLNVPLIRMLQKYGLEKFHFNLKQLGITSLKKPAAHYGLPLILGGAEANLWELTGVYASMARTLNHFYPYAGKYDPADFRMPYFQKSDAPPTSSEKNRTKNPPKLSAAAIFKAFEAMVELERPTEDGAWEIYQSKRKVAWKTGTSFGFRDAWAIGVTPRYAVGIWVGNADGEGRPGCVGITAAAPAMFAIFDRLPSPRWFDPPYDEMVKLPICRQSGYRAKEICGSLDTIWTPANGVRMATCPYHRTIFLDETEKFRVHSGCMTPSEMHPKAWFVLPPVEEFFYKSRNPSYQVLPSYRLDCQKSLSLNDLPMRMIYPNQNDMKIYVPIELDGTPGRTVFKVAHRNPKTTIFWHLDNVYLTSTDIFHEIELRPEAGKHRITLVDSEGNNLQYRFEILSKK